MGGFRASIFRRMRHPVHRHEGDEESPRSASRMHDAGTRAAPRFQFGLLLVLLAIPTVIVVSAGCGAIPVNLLGQATPTRAALPTLGSPESIVITATLTSSPTTEASPQPTATLVETPTVAPATIVVQVVPTLLPTFTPASAGGGNTQVKIFLIAIGDNGVSGPKIGCGDSAVGVIRVIPATKAPLTAALNELLSLHDKDYGQSGLYNSLYQSNLQLQSAAIVNGVATIKLTGTLLLGGECDDPRVDAQITNTALQFSTVRSVVAYLNGKPLKEFLSGK